MSSSRQEHLAHPHLPRILARSLARAGFETTPPTVLPQLNTGNAHDTFSAILLELVATFVVDRRALIARPSTPGAPRFVTLKTSGSSA